VKDPIVIGVVTAFGVLLLLPFLAWLILAGFVSEDGCAWIAGMGGCVPWVPTPSTV
jgi:hypothetical protein